jgi:hypothetical protein
MSTDVVILGVSIVSLTVSVGALVYATREYRREVQWMNAKRAEWARERHPAGRELRARGTTLGEARRPKPDPSDPYWIAQDAAFLRMTKGASFGEGVTLPSGRFMSGSEIEMWQDIEDHRGRI